MTNGDQLRKNLAKELSKSTGEWPSGSKKPSRHESVPVFTRGCKQNPPDDFSSNPLFLAADVVVPKRFTAGVASAAQEFGPPDVHIKIDAPVEPLASTFSRQRSHGSYPAFSHHTSYASATNSPRTGGAQDSLNEIVEVDNMPRIDYNNSSTDEPNLNVPIDVKNLNVIGAPPPGYYVREDPPLKRALREAHKIWIAPMVAGLPSILDN